MGPTLAYEYAIVDRFPAPDWLTDAPSLAALDDGTLICAVPVIVMPRHHEGSFATHYRATLEQLGMGTLHLYRSTDGGMSWTRLPERLDFLCGRLFRIGSDLHYLGVGHERRDAWLTRSRDRGMTWSARTRIAAGRFYAAASGMVADSGRLCWALGMANAEDEFNGTGSRVVVLAADPQRDLLDERTWRMSAPLTYPGTPASLRLPVPLAPGYRDHFLEPNVVEVAGGVRVILRCRIDHYATSHLAAVCDVEEPAYGCASANSIRSPAHRTTSSSWPTNAAACCGWLPTSLRAARTLPTGTSWSAVASSAAPATSGAS